MYSPVDVAKKINALLKEKGLSQKEMLEKCGLSKNAISSMLSRGSMLRADNIAKIADYIDCSVDYLLDRSQNPSNEGCLSTEEQLLLNNFHKLCPRDQREIEAFIAIKLEETKKDTSFPSPPHRINNPA